MNLRMYNTHSRKAENLRPLEPGRLGIYVCGPTVYDAPHLGHARSAVLFDVLRRFFEAQGNQVTLVRNITDIDDKILLRARQTGMDYRTIADRCRRDYEAAMAALNVRPPDAAPRATAYIQPCQDIIARILHNGHAYRSDSGIYFATRSCPGYGRLSGRTAARLRPGDTTPHNPDKRHPEDFALWKGHREGEPFWDSPWGPGRPGWHIECTAMGHTLLGTPFDIHGGGNDLIFPHHENEIAQSIAAFHRPPATTWLHHGMVTVGQDKMAKSKGNAPPLEQLLSTFHPEAVRLFLLSRPYRGPLPFSLTALQVCTTQLDRLYALARRLPITLGDTPPAAPKRSALWRQFLARMAADANTPAGLAALFTTVRELNRALDRTTGFHSRDRHPSVMATSVDLLYICRTILGVLQMPVEEYDRWQRAGRGNPLARDEIENLIAQRQAARLALDWTTADRLRSRLEQDGVRLQDHGRATKWRQGKRRGKVEQ